MYQIQIADILRKDELPPEAKSAHILMKVRTFYPILYKKNFHGRQVKPSTTKFDSGIPKTMGIKLLFCTSHEDLVPVWGDRTY